MNKKKIAFIVDADNWAFANIARNVSKNLSEYYEFKIIPTTYFDENIATTLIYAEDCDLLHFFWRGKLLTLDYYDFSEYVHSLGCTVETFYAKFIHPKIITTAVYDHLYLEGDSLNNTLNIVPKVDQYYVSSNRLFQIYKELPIPKQPYMVITDGVDLDYFYPKNEERFSNIKNRPLVIGWVGNSAWEKDKEDFKGVNTILKPALEELNEEGYAIEMFFADRQERMIPHDEMVDYYSKIDLYICASKIEGTPNPVLESMACVVPIISTDVGIVPDAFGPLQKKYILEERSKECLKEKIKMFIDNLEHVEDLRKENLKYIKNWSWKKISEKMKRFFDQAFDEFSEGKKSEEKYEESKSEK